MPDETLQSVLDRLRVRMPASDAEVAALRREVRDVDEAVGALLSRKADTLRASTPRNGVQA